MSAKWEDITLEEGALEKTPCDCCGKTTLIVEGDLFYEKEWFSFYSVKFAPQHLDTYPFFQVGTGDWSEDARKESRWLFGAEYSVEEQGFRLIDLRQDPPQANYTVLNRDDIIGTHFASDAFAMLDAIIMKDGRLEALHDVAH